MKLGFEVAGTVHAVVQRLRVFADALEAAGDKLPPGLDIVAFSEVCVTLYRPLQTPRKKKQEPEPPPHD